MNASSHLHWHALPPDESLERLASQHTGLDSSDAARRLAEHGQNRLPQGTAKSPLLRFAQQFHNLLIYVLLVAGVATALLGEWVDSAVIFAVVVINAAVGFIQEGKAEQAMRAIQNMLTLEARIAA